MKTTRHPIPLVFSILILVSACTTPGSSDRASASNDTKTPEAAIASLRREIREVHRRIDIRGFAELFTASGALEWQGLAQPVVGHAALEANRREVWGGRRGLTLDINLEKLSIHGSHAYEFVSFAERWLEPDGSRVTELGRYMTVYAVDAAGRWRIERLFGFTDSISKDGRAQ